MTAKKQQEVVAQAASDQFQAPVAQADPFAATIERLAANPDVDAGKIRELWEIQKDMMATRAETEFNSDFATVQAEMQPVVADAENKQTSSRYAKLAAIAKAIRPVYTAAGFSASWTQAKCERDNYIRLEGTLRHRAGHTERGYFVEVPLDMTGIAGKVNKTEMHGTGSAFQYARRYGTCGMFDVSVEDDDDGNGGGKKRVHPITDEQAITLQDHIASFGESDWQRDTVKALKDWAQVDTLAKLPADKFDSACRRVSDRAKATLK